MIDVKELTTYNLSDTVLKIGANMSLSNTMDLFNQTAQLNPKYGYLKTIADHIDLIAHVAVRNVSLFIWTQIWIKFREILSLIK